MAGTDPKQTERQNVAALIFLVVLVVLGALVFVVLERDSALVDCLSAGFRNCGTK